MASLFFYYRKAMLYCGHRFFQVEPDSAGGARCNRDHADEDGQEGSCAECEMEEIDTRRPVQRPARKRARRARRSPSLSAFEGEDDSLVRDSDSELDMHAVDSEPPSDFPTPLKNAYARFVCPASRCFQHTQQKRLPLGQSGLASKVI